MSAFLHDLTLFENDDLVSILDSRESVGNDYASLLSGLHELIKSLLDLMLTLSVKRAGGFVQQDHLGLANQGSSDSDTLFLASRESDTSLTNETIKALREEFHVLNEIEAVGHAACFSEAFHDLILTGTFKVDTVKNIVLDTAREQDWFLLNESDLLLMVPLVVQVLQVGS